MMLRHLALLASTLFPLIAFAQQTLVVDDAHSQLDTIKSQKAPAYVFKPDTQLLVDASAYQFKAAGATANSLQLVIANDRQYSVPWDATRGSVVVSSLTAHPNGNSQPFEKFVAGQKAIVAIGRLEGANFDVMWVGLVDIR